MNIFNRLPGQRGGVVWVLILMLLTAGAATEAAAESLDELLTQVPEAYAKAYSSPFLNSYGPNINSNLYSTASIPWGRLVFGFGIKTMGTQLNETDQTFSVLIENVDLEGFDPALVGLTGDVYMSGPTIFGDTETNGTVQAFAGGFEVFNAETIPGLVETTWSPFAMPEAYIGGIAGLRLTVRYLPELDLGDFGKTKLFGYGLQWNANGVLKNLPVDIMAGFFSQELDVGNVYQSEANSYFVAASKKFTMLTVYTGFAIEDSKLDVAYEFIHPSDPNLNSEVSFAVDGVQDSRFTVGATLNIFVNLNLEVAFGDALTTYSAGLMLGF
ncbi:MAG: hypothetical protein ACI9UK_000742 [Candidatus Krumholzibacteriia bacterium]|jgi:hypothetical protein